jgi:anti-sigma regulatory factor (Ser/Thr protein kinase)
MMTEVDLRLAGDATAAAEARRSLAVLAEKVSREVYEDVRLLVTELITNSVRHAALTGADPIRLRVTAERGVVRVEVEDDGNGFEPRHRNAPLTEASGWGLYLVDKLTDRWGVNSGGATCVWFEIDAATS